MQSCSAAAFHGKNRRGHARDDVGGVDALQLRLRHPAEVTEAANNGLEISDLHAQCLGALAKNFIEFRVGQTACADEILNRELQRKERIFQLMREAAGKLSPRCYALALDELFRVAR